MLLSINRQFGRTVPRECAREDADGGAFSAEGARKPHQQCLANRIARSSPFLLTCALLTMSLPEGAQLSDGGAWQRNFSSGVALVNPSSTATHSVQLDASRAYQTRHGAAVDGTRPVVLPPTIGAVLLYA